MNKTTIIAIIFLLTMAVFPFLVDSAWLGIGITFLVFAVVAFSQDIILGRAGIFNMGHAIFFGIGAYTTAILNVHFGFEIIATVPFAIILPIIISILLAGPIIHLRGDYLLVATIGFNIIFEQVLKNNVFDVTGGPSGIFGIDVVRIFGYELYSDTAIYYIAFGLLLITLFIIRNLDNSKYGRALYYINKKKRAKISSRFTKNQVQALRVSDKISTLSGSILPEKLAFLKPSTRRMAFFFFFFSFEKI